MTLLGINSKIARKRKRGESPEDYEKRIRAMESRRLSMQKQRAKKKAAPPASSFSTDKSSDLSTSKVTSLAEVAEHAIQLDTEERRRAEKLVLELQAQLERERREKAELLRAVEARNTTLAKLHEAEHKAKSLEVSTSAKAFEIIEISDECVTEDSDREIIEEFSPCVSAFEEIDTTTRKLPESQGFSGDVYAPESTTGQNPLKGFWPVAADSATIDLETASDQVDAEADQVPPRPERPRASLVDAVERILVIGWLDRARQGNPTGKLTLAFGPVQRRVWLNVVGSIASECGVGDLEVESEVVPFAYELVWPLRLALQHFAPGVPVAELAWRTLGMVAAPRGRATLGVLAGLETMESINRRYATVEREIQRGQFVLDRNAQIVVRW